MIGRKEQAFSFSSGIMHPISFNLSGPIQFADSKVTHGTQLADALAAAAVWVFSGAEDDHTNKWKDFMHRVCCYGSMLPELDILTLKDFRAQQNTALLLELHSRATKGLCLTQGIEKHVRLTSKLLLKPPFSAGHLEKSHVPVPPGQLRPDQAMSLIRHTHEKAGFFEVPCIILPFARAASVKMPMNADSFCGLMMSSVIRRGRRVVAES